MALKRNEIRTDATPWMSLEDMLLRPIIQSQRQIRHMGYIPEVPGVASQRDRKQKGSCQGLRRGRWGVIIL